MRWINRIFNITRGRNILSSEQFAEIFEKLKSIELKSLESKLNYLEILLDIVNNQKDFLEKNLFNKLNFELHKSLIENYDMFTDNIVLSEESNLSTKIFGIELISRGFVSLSNNDNQNNITYENYVKGSVFKFLNYLDTMERRQVNNLDGTLAHAYYSLEELFDVNWMYFDNDFIKRYLINYLKLQRGEQFDNYLLGLLKHGKESVMKWDYDKIEKWLEYKIRTSNIFRDQLYFWIHMNVCKTSLKYFESCNNHLYLTKMYLKLKHLNNEAKLFENFIKQPVAPDYLDMVKQNLKKMCMFDEEFNCEEDINEFFIYFDRYLFDNIHMTITSDNDFVYVWVMLFNIGKWLTTNRKYYLSEVFLNKTEKFISDPKIQSLCKKLNIHIDLPAMMIDNYFISKQYHKVIEKFTFTKSFPASDLKHLNIVRAVNSSYIQLKKYDQAETFLKNCCKGEFISEMPRKDQDDLIVLTVKLIIENSLPYNHQKALHNLKSISIIQSYLARFQYFKEIEGSHLKPTNDSRICFLFNTIKIDQDPITNILKSFNYRVENIFENFNSKNMKLIIENDLSKYDKCLVLVYVIGNNNEIFFNGKTRNIDELIRNYFVNSKFKFMKNKPKYFFINLFSTCMVKKYTNVCDKLKYNLKQLEDTNKKKIINFDVYLNELLLIKLNFEDHLNSTSEYKFLGWNNNLVNFVNNYDYLVNYGIPKEKPRKRLCIILSSETDDVSHQDPENQKLTENLRYGDTYDRMKLIFVFLKMKYQVQLLLNRSGSQIKEYFELMLYDDELSNYESITLFILSHGNENGVFIAYDQVNISIIEDIIKPINQSIYLINKPKLIFINACRGDKNNFNNKIIHKMDTDFDTNKYKKLCDLFEDTIITDEVSSEANGGKPVIKNLTNIMIVYSTIEGYVSYRDKREGTWYIQSLLNAMGSFSDEIDLSELLEKANKILVEEYPDNEKVKDINQKQMTEIVFYDWKIPNYSIGDFNQVRIKRRRSI